MDYDHIYTEKSKKNPILLISSIRNTKIDLFEINYVLRTCPVFNHVKPLATSLIKVFFITKVDANAFLVGVSLLEQNSWQAKVPYGSLESQGTIKVPTELSEEDLLTNMKASIDVTGIKRFARKNTDGSFILNPTVLVTLLSSRPPHHINLWSHLV